MTAAVWDTGDVSALAPARLVAPLAVLSQERTHATRLYQAHERLRALVHVAACIEPEPRWQTEQERLQLLDEQLDAFFEAELAPAIQHRETTTVAVMQQCVRSELQTLQDKLQTTTQQNQALVERITVLEQETSLSKSKLDRRVAENNELRKDFYKQLLMLREMVNKNRNDPRTLKILDDEIVNITQDATSREAWDAAGDSGYARYKGQTSAKGGDTNGLPAGSMRREKEKWEERARETMTKCHQLQQQIVVLKQQNETLRGTDSDMWFLSSQHGLMERQRIMDAIYRSKCTWKHVGEAIVELLNNDLLWQAVEDSIREEKPRVSRGLEALILQLDQLEEEQQDSNGQHAGATKARIFGRRRSSLGDSGRLIPCESCNGSGYLDAENDSSGESDSYLRKTLAQVLELKSSLDQANSRLAHVENELQGTHAQAAATKEKLRVIEQTRLHCVEYGTQADLDDEEPVSLDEIMNAFNDPGNNSRSRLRRKGHRQHEHLIVELKSSLTEKETGLIEARTILADTQARLLSLQRKSQRDQEVHQQETTALKTSLTLAMNNRSSAIDEKQAAVKLMLKRIDKQMQLKKQHIAQGSHSSILSADEESDEDGEDNVLDGFPDPTAHSDGQDEIQRSEMVARRYTEAIVRVQKEYEDQQAMLRQAEQEDNDEATNRKRTNSITLGNIVVTMASHPRDLFKALSTAKTEILHMRRATQRASTLQTDRLLTLTTHLGHISEELCMVRKRTTAEIEYWKLECEKLQHSNKSITTNLHRAQSQLQTRSERQSTFASAKSCALCEKHQARLMEMSNKLISESLDAVPHPMSTDSDGGAVNEHEHETDASQASAGLLSESDRTGLSVAMLELESVYATLSKSKQENARSLLMQALLSFDGSVDVNSSAQHGLSSSSMSPHKRRKNNAETISKSSSTFEAAMQNRRLRSRLSSRLSQSAVRFEDSKIDEPSTNQVFADTSISRRVSYMSPSVDSRSPSLRLSVAPLDGDIDRFNNCADDLDVQGTQYFMQRTDLSPAHQRKKIVRKILSEEEVLQRRRARRQTLDYANSVTDRHNELKQQLELSQEIGISEENEVAAEDFVATYVDSDGRKIHYIEEEIDDDEEAFLASERDESQQPEHFDNQSTSEVITPMQKRLSTHALHTDSTNAEDPEDMSRSSMDASHSFSVLNDYTGIERDPQILSDLQGLVKQSTSMKESMALTNWTILISHIRTRRDQKRLEQITRESKRVMPTIDGPASSFLVVRSTMQKLVQYREMFLDALTQARNQLRSDMRKLHARLIYSVSTILSDLTRKNIVKKALLPNYPRVTVSSSPPKSPTNNRILYPAVQVNLNAIPPTQQIPTHHFPLSSSSIARPSSATTPISQSEGKMRQVVNTSASSSQTVLACEDGKRFPQRSMKFMGALDGPELSLTHSTSGIISKEPSLLPSDSSTRSSISRMTTSASPKRTALSTVVEQIYRTSKPSKANSSDPAAIRQPSRPRSSPGDMAPRSSPRNPEALSRALAAFSRQETPDTAAKSGISVRPPESAAATLAVRIPTQRQMAQK